MHCSANVGERGRRRDLLRALRHGQDDALGRSRALADRRRRARLGRRRRLQLRGRLLREGDQPLRRGRAGDLPDDAARSGRSSRTSSSTSAASSTSTTARRPRTRAPRTSSSRSRTRLPAKRAGHPAVGALPHRRRVRDPAADRAADARPGDVLVPLRLHGEARRHGDRRQGAAADLLRLLRRAVPAAAPGRLRAAARRRGSTSTARRSGS